MWLVPNLPSVLARPASRRTVSVPVTVFRYTCEGTIEERIQAILASKQQLFDEVIDDVSFDVASRLTSDELFGLFGLEAPTPRARRQ